MTGKFDILILIIVAINLFAMLFFFGGLRNKLINVERTLDAMYNYFKNKYGNAFVAACSPLNVTEEGTEFMSDNKLDIYMDSIFDSILSEVKSKNPTTKYEVQELLINEIIKKLMDKTKVEQIAYDKGLNSENIYKVCAVYIRDRIINGIPNLT